MVQELSRVGDQKGGNGSLWVDFKSVVELKVKPRLQWYGRLNLFLDSSEREQKRSLTLGLSCPPEEL